MKTLIADDDDITRLLLSSALTKLGQTVREATNGREAWEAWQSGEFPLIISDWMMPDLDGLEFCRRIRAEPRAGLHLHHPAHLALREDELPRSDERRRGRLHHEAV